MDSSSFQIIKDLALELGFCLMGAADIREIKETFLDLSPETVRRFDRAISLAVRLSDAVIEDIADHPTPLYFHHYRQANAFLDRGAFEIARRIQEMGGNALPIAASQLVDWKNQRGHLSHKEVARLAGLGWIGRNNLLVNSRHGARIRLVTVLTDLPLETASSLKNDCGECCACVTVCPTEAIKERREDFDHLKCYEQLTLFKNKYNLGHHICGLCVKACRGEST